MVGTDGSWPWRVIRVLLVVLLLTGARRASRNDASRLATIALVALATLSLVAAATIGVAYSTRAGVCLRAIAGLIVAAGSIGLLLGGVAALGRGAMGWRRWLRWPVGLVAMFVTISTIFPAVYATNAPRAQLGGQRPGDYGLAYVDARFETADGLSLSGWYVPSTNGAAVVLLHGASSTRTSVLDQAVVLAHHGYGVLMFDARGHGGSEGRAMEFGWYGDADVAAAIDYVEARPDVDRRRIGAVGMSMGGEEAIGAMAGDLRIRATVAEGATNRVYADKTWYADTYGVRGRAQLLIEWLSYQLTDVLTSAAPPLPLGDAVRAASPRPVLLVVAGAVEEERLAAESIRSNAPESVTMWVVAGAEHTRGLATSPEEWARRVVGFLDTALAA